MPKTAMDKYYRAGFSDHKVWAPRKISNLLRKLAAQQLQSDGYSSFRRGAGSTDPSHDIASEFRGKTIH